MVGGGLEKPFIIPLVFIISVIYQIVKINIVVKKVSHLFQEFFWVNLNLNIWKWVLVSLELELSVFQFFISQNIFSELNEADGCVACLTAFSKCKGLLLCFIWHCYFNKWPKQGFFLKLDIPKTYSSAKIGVLWIKYFVFTAFDFFAVFIFFFFDRNEKFGIC